VEQLKGFQRQTVAKYARAKVYTKAEALAVVESMARRLTEDLQAPHTVADLAASFRFNEPKYTLLHNVLA
jgi:cell fate (sporulation/competence/biofilm development) regulator YmcA (YheA/YmcA/DUF963 family)